MLKQHLTETEFSALAQSVYSADQRNDSLTDASLERAIRHMDSCEDCAASLKAYRQAQGELSNLLGAGRASAYPDCPQGVDWFSCVSGMIPEAETRELLNHAALCEHCGPALREAFAILSDQTTPEEEAFVASLPESIRDPRRPIPEEAGVLVQFQRQVQRWTRVRKIAIQLVAAMLVLVAAVFLGIRMNNENRKASDERTASAEFSRIAAQSFRRVVQQKVPLDLNSDSADGVIQYVAGKSELKLKIPNLSKAAEAPHHYEIEGVRMVPVGSSDAAYVSYTLDAEPVGLMISADSVARALGGVEVGYTKDLRFHYQSDKELKIVTWTIHGLTYALVSDSHNPMQSSCMACHAGMNDHRDFTKIPNPKMPVNPIPFTGNTAALVMTTH